MKSLSTYFLVLFVFALLVSCGGTSLPTVPKNPGAKTAAQLILEGWVQFELSNYEGAIELFNEASIRDSNVLDSFNGLGWSHFRNHNLVLSRTNFRRVIDVDSTLIDAQVGFSFTTFERNEYTTTINTIVNVAIQDTSGFDRQGNDDYFFIHDASVSSNDVRKILALSYYYIGSFQESFNQLVTYLDPFTEVDPQSETFTSDLLIALEKQ